MHTTPVESTRAEPQAPPPDGVLILRTAASNGGKKAWFAAAVAAAAAAAIVTGLIIWSARDLPFRASGEANGPVERLVLPSEAADLSIILDTDVMPMTAEDARALNDQRPRDVAQVTPALPFQVAPGAGAPGQYEAALECLAQAIYYEAASEPEEGQRAVAQVVLNRVKHPAFPNTICGVVYQGSRRVTGCQFTFTCDGSLARAPVPALYRRAERLAREALSGRVAPAVGNSTNYHADYVVPYWASSLDKLTQIGRHIFYGLRGAIGYRSAFRMAYDVSHETASQPAPLIAPPNTETPLPDPLIALPGALSLGETSRLSEDAASGALIPGAARSAIVAPSPSPLRADQESGRLIDPGSRPDQRPAEAEPAPDEPR